MEERSVKAYLIILLKNPAVDAGVGNTYRVVLFKARTYQFAFILQHVQMLMFNHFDDNQILCILEQNSVVCALAYMCPSLRTVDFIQHP